MILKALKTHGMLLSDGGEIALTFADDRNSTAKWADLGIEAQSFNDIGVDQFEVVELGDGDPAHLRLRAQSLSESTDRNCPCAFRVRHVSGCRACGRSGPDWTRRSSG